MTSQAANLIAVDVGNSRVKYGLFLAAGPCAAPGGGDAPTLPIAPGPLREPDETLTADAPPTGDAAARLREWLAGHLGDAGARGAVASVNGPAAGSVLDVLRATLGPAAEVRMLASAELPIELRVEAPQRVGIDRVVAAIAANRLRAPGRPAIVVDLGTAITVDLISGDGAFEGGAILPGIGLAARALHEQTHALPLSSMRELEDSHDAVGKSTEAAIRAGLFWGAVGGVREVIARQRDRLTQPPQVFLTGGAAPSVARLIATPDCPVRFVPHLVLSGIAAVSL